MVQYAKITAEVMDYLLPELKVIGRYGVGVDTIDLDAASQRGITVVNVPDYGAQSVADHAITLAAATARNLQRMETIARSGSLDAVVAAPIHQFCDMSFGVVGYGSIGKACAAKARGLGFATSICDPIIDADTHEVDGFPVASFDELLASSDIVSLHLPLLPSTCHMIDDEAIAKMRDGAILINTSRGSLVDTEALIRAIRSGKLLGAGLDVFETEPLPDDSGLKDLERVYLTPHAAYYSAESYVALKARAIQNVIDVLKGRPCRNIVATLP